MSRKPIFLIGKMNNQIMGSKLPSKRDCLSVLFYNMRMVRLNLQESASLVIDECLIFWRKARIPTQELSHCLKKLKNLYEDWRKLGKSKKKGSEGCILKQKEFEDSLNDLFDIAHANALCTIKIEEDKQFLIMQRRKGRPGCMMGTDLKLTGDERRREERRLKQSQRNENDSRTPEPGIETAQDIISSDSDESEGREFLEDLQMEIEPENDPSPAGPSGNKRARREILTARLSAALDKCKVSDRDAVHLLTACAESMTVNINEYVINRSSIRRARTKFRQQTGVEIKSKFSELNLQFVVVHWDSKILPDITGKFNVDRLPIMVTAPNIEQLLAVPELSSSTGQEVSSVVYDTLQDWELLDKVQACVFDTTASNTGRLNGACVLLEQKLNRNILSLACRHHVFEIVLQGVFAQTRLSVMSGPDIPLFKRFRNEWKNINQKHFSTWTTDATVFETLEDVSDEVILFAEIKLKEDLPRDDYKEFLELIIIFLGRIPSRGLHFRQPGAFHFARWMAKAIYCLKIFLFRKQFKINRNEETALKEICSFVVKCYAQAWFSSTNAIQAPLNDITFLRKLVAYKNNCAVIAETAIKKFIKHLWYLSEECAIFSLFDERIDVDAKRKMAAVLLQEKDEPEEESDKKINLKLSDVPHFISRDLPAEILSSKSLKTLERFNISYEFLKEDPTLWNDRTDYKNGLEVIGSLKVVNDAAERGVKLIEEFNQKMTKDEEQKQFLLQVVQDYRRKYPEHSRKTLQKPYNG